MRKCYRQSALQSAVMASMLVFHRTIGTWSNKITRFIALNEFCRNKLIEGGLPGQRIVIKPNFVFDPKKAWPSLVSAPHAREGFFYVGRFSAEKGISVLAQACHTLRQSGSAIVVAVAGTGPEEAVLDSTGVVRMGVQTQAQVMAQMHCSQALILPSICYESFPRTLVEAYACGLPVIASRLGPMAELVKDGQTGLLFEPGDAQDLAKKMQWAQDNSDAMRRMGEQARALYLRELDPQRNVELLLGIYEEAIEARRLSV